MPTIRRHSGTAAKRDGGIAARRHIHTHTHTHIGEIEKDRECVLGCVTIG